MKQIIKKIILLTTFGLIGGLTLLITTTGFDMNLFGKPILTVKKVLAAENELKAGMIDPETGNRIPVDLDQILSNTHFYLDRDNHRLYSLFYRQGIFDVLDLETGTVTTVQQTDGLEPDHLVIGADGNVLIGILAELDAVAIVSPTTGESVIVSR